MRDELAVVLRKVGAQVLDCRREGNLDGQWEGTQYKAAADLIADDSLRKRVARNCRYCDRE